MNKNVFYFPIWGEAYIKLFNNFGLNCLYRNLIRMNKDNLKNSKIEIWTFKQDIKKIKSLPQIKKLVKKIEINYESIDELHKNLSNFNLNKYQFLSVLQKIFINSHSSKFEFLWFIYPDFIFSDNLVKNFFKLKKKYKAYFIPVPQLIEEKVIKEFNKKNFKPTTKNITKMFFDYLHPIVKICDVNESKTNTPSLFLSSDKNSIIFKYYHMHPLIIKSDIENYNMNNKFYSSLDEGLVGELDEKKIFIAKSNYFGICASLLKEKEYKLPNERFNFKRSLEWCKNHVNKTHVEISKFTYTVKRKRNIPFNKKLERQINNRLIKLNSKINKFYQINNVYLSFLKIDTVILNNNIYEFISKNYFKKYFQIDNSKLKQNLKKRIKPKDLLSRWLKNIYIKNL